MHVFINFLYIFHNKLIDEFLLFLPDIEFIMLTFVNLRKMILNINRIHCSIAIKRRPLRNFLRFVIDFLRNEDTLRIRNCHLCRFPVIIKFQHILLIIIYRKAGLQILRMSPENISDFCFTLRILGMIRGSAKLKHCKPQKQ